MLYAYCRTNRTGEGPDLRAQRRALTSFADVRGVTIADWFIDRSVSGATPLCERRQGRALLNQLVRGDVALVSACDRLWHHLLDMRATVEVFGNHGFEIWALDVGATPDGRMNLCGHRVFRAVLDSLTNFDQAVARERQTDEGRPTTYQGGGRPFGFAVADDGGLEVDEDEQDIALEIVAKRDVDGLSYRQIAAWLESSHEGRSWHPETVKRIYERSRIAIPEKDRPEVCRMIDRLLAAGLTDWQEMAARVGAAFDVDIGADTIYRLARHEGGWTG